MPWRAGPFQRTVRGGRQPILVAVDDLSPAGAGGLARDVLWNIGGLVIPVATALVAIPVLDASLGTERFAVLTLAWAVLGYFSLFDAGLGRATTRAVARR